MNRTKDELLLECIKQFEHIENVLGYDRLSTTQSLIDEINQALTIPAVVGRSESFVCGHPPNATYLNEGVWHCEKCGGKWNSLANQCE